MSISDLNEIPLISAELVSELYGDTSDPEMLEMQKEIWTGISRDLPREIEEIQNLSLAGGEPYKKLLHRVAGYVGSGGLGRCCEILRALEYQRVPQEEAAELLALLPEICRKSMSLMESTYPHLASSA